MVTADTANWSTSVVDRRPFLRVEQFEDAAAALFDEQLAASVGRQAGLFCEARPPYGRRLGPRRDGQSRAV